MRTLEARVHKGVKDMEVAYEVAIAYLVAQKMVRHVTHGDDEYDDVGQEHLDNVESMSGLIKKLESLVRRTRARPVACARPVAFSTLAAFPSGSCCSCRCAADHPAIGGRRRVTWRSSPRGSPQSPLS